MAKKRTGEGKNPAKPRPAGADKQLRKQERIEQRRREKEAAARAAQRRARRERLIRWVLIGGAVAFAAWFFLRNQAPGEIRGHEIEKFSVGASGQHVSGTVNYPMTPPVGGQHAAGAAPCGVHPSRIANENMVHSLEHGAVGLLYDPATADEDDIRALEDIVGDVDTNIFSAPFSGMETPVAIISWGEMMRLDSVDEVAVREYVREFAGKAPESSTQECTKGVDQPYQEPTPAPTGSPGATIPVPEQT
jgi:hypothetical protein